MSRVLEVLSGGNGLNGFLRALYDFWACSLSVFFTRVLKQIQAALWGSIKKHIESLYLYKISFSCVFQPKRLSFGYLQSTWQLFETKIFRVLQQESLGSLWKLAWRCGGPRAWECRMSWVLLENVLGVFRASWYNWFFGLFCFFTFHGCMLAY